MFARLARPGIGIAMKRKLDGILCDKISSLPPGAATTKKRAMASNIGRLVISPDAQLTHHEARLRSLLLDVTEFIDKQKSVGEPVVLRWAGGWVRDKLLGIESHDIDVAINTMTGASFAQHISDYCDTAEAAQKHNFAPADVGNIHKVARNPEKSKHLETAMVRIFGLGVDFVNLRKETYSQNSRNPQIEFGTAQEDALRRDATINALFYNLHSNEVEDFTGGLNDMEAKLIRTPLEPLQTFTDDPLRVLRLVRFASRLGFAIEPDTQRYMAHPKVLDSLKIKISRERVGIELEKMLKDKHARESLKLIDSLQLYHAIFTDPGQSQLPRPDTSKWHVVYDGLEQLLQNQNPDSIGRLLVLSDDATYIAWQLAAIAPWMAAPSHERKPNTLPTVAMVAREGYKAPKKLSDIVAASDLHRKEISDLKSAVDAKMPWIQERDKVGMAIRRWDASSGSWRLQILNALLVDAMQNLDRWEGQGRDQFIQSWQSFLDHLAKLDVYETPALKPLLDGRALAAALGVKPGRWTGKALEQCIAWQLRHPGEADPAGAIEEIRTHSIELGIDA